MNNSKNTHAAMTMTNYTTSPTYECGFASLGYFAITFLFIVSPMHMFVMKVLAFNIRFEMPRHIILFSLAASDCLQILLTAMCMTVQKVAKLSAESPVCSAVRGVMQFNGAATVVISSLTLVALSFERYIMCFYCYRFHDILTNKRVASMQCFIWVCGLVSGGAVVSDFKSGRTDVLFSQSNGSFTLLVIIVTFTVSLSLAIVQSRLFWLSIKKLNRVGPEISFHRNNKEYGRRRQFKITFVASMVILAYLVSMLPSSCLILTHRFIKESPPPVKLQIAVVSIGMVNTLFNPLIYGLGIADTRQAIKRELERIKTFI